MKNYLRLVFISAILLVLVGLFNDQSDDTIKQDQKTGEIEHAEFQAELPSLYSSFLPVSLDVLITPEYSDSYTGKLKHSENLISSRIENLFFTLTSDYSNRKPEIIFKKGLLQHLETGPDDPSLL